MKPKARKSKSRGRRKKNQDRAYSHHSKTTKYTKWEPNTHTKSKEGKIGVYSGKEGEDLAKTYDKLERLNNFDSKSTGKVVGDVGDDIIEGSDHEDNEEYTKLTRATEVVSPTKESKEKEISPKRSAKKRN